MEDIFKDSNTVITPALDEFYSNSFLIKGNPANENVLPAPQVGGANDDKSDIKSLINKLNNVSDISANKISNIQANYTDPLADAKMFTFNPTYKGLNWDRYKNHSDFDKLGFDPFRDNEKFYNDNSSIFSDVTRAAKGFGYLALGTGWESAKDLYKLVTFDFSPNTEGAKNSERILSESMSTRGTFGSSVINFGVNAGFTVGIIGELIAEEMLLAAVGLGGSFETGGASLGAAGYLAAVRANLAVSKIASIPKTTGALLKTLKNLDNAVEAKKYFTQFGRGAAEFLNPLQSTTDLVRNWDKLNGLGQVARASQSFGAFFKDIRNINRSFSEAKLEGGFVQNTMFEKLLGEAYADGKTPSPEEIDKIKEISLHAGYMTELINFPVIQYTNNITFGALTRPLRRLIGTTEDSIRMLNKTITTDITRKEVFQELAGGWKEAFKRGINPRLMAKNTLNYFSANIAEGLQESFQEATSIAMEDYYTKLYNNQNSIVQAHQELSMLDSYGKGIGAQFSGQGAETFLSGFLMGGLMHKSVSGVKGVITGINESSNAIKDLFYSKTNPESFKEAKEAREIKKAEKEATIKKYDEYRNNFIESQNAFFKDAGKMFSRDIAHMSAQEIIDAKAKHAQETGDYKFLIDQTDASLFENVANAQYFGKFDLYIEHLEKIKSLDDQGLMEAMGIDDAQAGRQRLEVSIDRAKNIKQRLEKAPKNPFNYNDYKEGTPEYNEMIFMHNAFEDARNAAVFTPYHFDRVLSRMNSISKDFSAIDLVANGNATEFLHLFGEKNIAEEVAILFQEKESLKDGTPENEKLAKEKDKQIAGLIGVRNAIIAHKGYFKALKENEEVDPQYEKNLKKAFVQYLSAYANIKKSILKSDKLDAAFKLFHDFHRLNIDSELLSKSVAIVADPDFLRQESLRRYNAIKKLYDNKKELIKKKWDVYFRKIGLNGVFQKLYDAGFAGDPEQMVAYNLSGGKAPVTKFYRTKDFSLVTFADVEDIAKINEIFSDYEDITGITKEKEEAAKKAAEAAAKKAEEEAEAARVAEKAKAVENFTPETKAKLVAAYDKYERKDIETFEEYIESAPEAKRIIAEEKQPTPVVPTPAPIVPLPPTTPISDIEAKRQKELEETITDEDDLLMLESYKNDGNAARISKEVKRMASKTKKGSKLIEIHRAEDDVDDLNKPLHERVNAGLFLQGKSPMHTDAHFTDVLRNITSLIKDIENGRTHLLEKEKSLYSEIIKQLKKGNAQDIALANKLEAIQSVTTPLKGDSYGIYNGEKIIGKTEKEIINEINAKYQAELDSLKKKETPQTKVQPSTIEGQVGTSNYTVEEGLIFYENEDGSRRPVANPDSRPILDVIKSDIENRRNEELTKYDEGKLTNTEIKVNNYKAYLHSTPTNVILKIGDRYGEMISEGSGIYGYNLEKLINAETGNTIEQHHNGRDVIQSKYDEELDALEGTQTTDSKADVEKTVLGSFANTTERVVNSKGPSNGRTLRTELTSKISSDGEVIVFKSKNTFTDNEDSVISAPASMSIEEFKEHFYPMLTADEIEMFEETLEVYKEDGWNGRIFFKELRVGSSKATNLKGQVNLDIMIGMGNDYGFTLTKRLTDAELDALQGSITKTDTEGSLFDKFEEDYGKDYADAIEYATSYLAKETINVDKFLEYLKKWDLTNEGKIGAIESAISTFNKYNLTDKENALKKLNAELTTLKSGQPKEEPKVKEPFPLSPQFEGKIIYFSPGLGKTTLVNQYPDQFVDMDVLLYEEFKDEPGFENATPETFGSTISAIYKRIKNDQPSFDAFDAIKNTHYNNAFKKAKTLASQGKTVLTGSGAFISRADFSVKATNEKISKEQLKNKTPGIDPTDLSEAMSGIRRNENRNNILMSVDKDSFTQFLMGNYDILQYINDNITFEQLDELGNFITSDMPEVVEAFNKKMEYLQAKILLFTNLQPGDTVIVLNEKTGENVKTKIMKKRSPDSYDLELTPGLEISTLNRNRLNTLINVIPAQGESEGIKVDDLDNADAENNKTKVNDIATETERLKALLEKPFNDDNLFDDAEDPNNCKTK